MAINEPPKGWDQERWINGWKAYGAFGVRELEILLTTDAYEEVAPCAVDNKGWPFKALVWLDKLFGGKDE